jgi:hypothetical protein
MYRYKKQQINPLGNKKKQHIKDTRRKQKDYIRLIKELLIIHIELN